MSNIISGVTIHYRGLKKDISRLFSIKNIKRNSIVNDIVHTYISKIFLILLGIAGNIILTRNLGVAHYGTYAFTMTVITLGTQFGNCGLHAANLHYAARKKLLLGMLLKNSMVFALVFGGIVSITVAFFVHIFPALLNIKIETAIIVVCIIPLSLFSLFMKNLLVGVGKIKLDNKITVAVRCLTTILLLSLAVCYALTPDSALIVFGVGITVGGWLVFLLLRKEVTKTYKISLKLLQHMSKFGLKAYLSALLAFLVLKSDLFFVNYYLSKEELGCYSLAVSLADYVYLLPVVIGTILFQKLSSLKNDAEKYEIMKQISTYFVVGFSGILLMVFVFSGYLIPFVFGDDFSNSIPILRILLIAIFFMGMQTIKVQYLNTTGYPKEIIYYWAVAILLNIVINISFIQQYRLYAVALSTVSAYLLIFLLVLFKIHRENMYSKETVN